MNASPFFHKKYQYIAAAFIFFAVFLIGVYHSAHGGINLTDEGLYVAAPYHYKFGVVPFRDAIHNATRQYDLLLAPIFWIYPQISLLQFRILGVLLHLSGLFALFLLFSRFSPPLLVAAICAILFLVNNFLGTPSPSYNLLVSTFASWAFVFWMYSLFTTTRKSTMFSIGAGIALSFAIISNISAGVIVVIPFVFALLFWKRGNYQYAMATAVVIATVASVFFLCSMALYISGILPYYLDALRNDALSSNVSVGGVGSKIWRSIRELWFMLPHALYIVIVSGVSLFFLKARPKKIPREWWLGIGIIVIFLMLLPTVLYFLYYMTIVIVSLLLVPFIWFSLQRKRGIERVTWGSALVWGLVQMVVYASFSTNGLQSAVKGSLTLVIVAVLSVYEVYYGGVIEKNKHERAGAIYGVVVLGMLLLVFVINGVRFHLSSVYLDFKPEKLTSIFHHPKLAGLYSVPEKIEPLEKLLAYLKPRVKPGDYFLAYNDLPILYYLTDTQPAYPNVWAFEFWWPRPYREKLFQQMLASGHTAQYAVHMVTNPGYGWVTPVAEGQSFDNLIGSCMVCEYVEKNYVLEKMIFPFEIWRRGDGPKLELLKDFSLYYEDRLRTWKNMTISEKQMVPMAPFWVESTYGNYVITTRQEEGESVVRFTVISAPLGVAALDISYFSERTGFSFVPSAAEEVAVAATLRVAKRRTVHPYYNALLFVQDRFDDIYKALYITNAENTKGYPPLWHKDSEYWVTNSVAVYRPEWHTYLVTKKLRDKAIHLNFGFTWVPTYPGDWIEIKDIRLYTNKAEKAKAFQE